MNIEIAIATAALKRIAEEESVCIETIRTGIEDLMNEARMNEEPEVQAFWESVPCKGSNPIPEEFIAHLTNIAIESNLIGEN